jgi:hypothetical protein
LYLQLFSFQIFVLAVVDSIAMMIMIGLPDFPRSRLVGGDEGIEGDDMLLATL